MLEPNCFLMRSMSGSPVISVVIEGALRAGGAGRAPAAGAAFGGAALSLIGARGGVGLVPAAPVAGGTGVVFCGVDGSPVADAPSSAGVFDGLAVPGSATSSLASVLTFSPAGKLALAFASASSAGEMEPAMGGKARAFSGTSAPTVSVDCEGGGPACPGETVVESSLPVGSD